MKEQKIRMFRIIHVIRILFVEFGLYYYVKIIY